MSSRTLMAAILAAALLLSIPLRAAAHGHTEVGIYELTIGFHNEPALQGEPNGLDLFVTNTQTGERVNGLENSLQVEIIYGGSTRELSLEPQFGQDGAYTAYLIPTEAGDYTWHIFGTIEDTPVDVSMTSAPDTFSSIVSKAELSFPSAEASAAELAAHAEAAAGTARTALILGAIGVGLGLLGLGFGLLGFQAARRRTAYGPAHAGDTGPK